MRLTLFMAAMVIAHSATAAQFPGQSESGRTSTITYGNEVPSHATFPLAGHDMFRAERPGTIECIGRTYVPAARMATATPQHDDSYLQTIMSKGGCMTSGESDPAFRVERFEAFDAPFWHADLAYVVVHFTAKEAGGVPLTIHFYIDRRDIIPAHQRPMG